MKKQIIIVAIVLILVLGGAVFANKNTASGQYDTFATCIKDSGATFYGAFWCPHCRDQKKMFGNSAKLLPYIECSTPDGKSQKPMCTEREIKSYPTWVFADGHRGNGSLSFIDLASSTGCALPTAVTPVE